jgi:serine/threonine protein kinase
MARRSDAPQARPETRRADDTMKIEMPQVGDILADRYELVEKLGKGAFGSVFRARQLGIDRMVAIKLLMPDAEVVDGMAPSSTS